MQHSYIIFIPENNLGQEAEHARHMLRNERKLYTIHEKKKAGVCTTHARKEAFAQEMLDLALRWNFSGYTMDW